MKPRVKYNTKTKEFMCGEGLTSLCSWWYGFGKTPEEAYINFCSINQFRIIGINDNYHLAA